MSIKQNLVVGYDETFDLNIEYQDSDGNPVDLTGHTVDLVLTKAGSKTEIGTYPATVDDSGNIAIHVTDEVVATWPLGKSGYKVVHTDPDGNEGWLVYGGLAVVIPS